MSVNDQYVLNDTIYRMLENGNADANGTLLTNMFSVPEIIDSMNRVQQKFLLDTGMIVTRTVIPGAIGQGTYALPTDNIAVRRVCFGDCDDINALTQEDTNLFNLEDDSGFILLED